jgi:hypothetical protein
MGHNVSYLGKLTPKNSLNEGEQKLFELLRDDNENYDRLYALEYQDGSFTVDDSNEKIYPDNLFDSIEKYVNELKKGGNDIVEGGYLISCSEYGIDSEAMVLVYKNGSFERHYLTTIVKEYLSSK